VSTLAPFEVVMMLCGVGFRLEVVSGRMVDSWAGGVDSDVARGWDEIVGKVADVTKGWNDGSTGRVQVGHMGVDCPFWSDTGGVQAGVRMSLGWFGNTCWDSLNALDEVAGDRSAAHKR
jgi:hypothetical protein